MSTIFENHWVLMETTRWRNVFKTDKKCKICDSTDMYVKH